MRSRLAVLSAAVLAISLAWPAHATEVILPPISLSEWLRADIAFVGLGEVSTVAIDPSTGYASFSLTLLEAWKGTAPRTVTFTDMPFANTRVSEGQRMVYYAFVRKGHPRPLKYASPEPVFRMGGHDCFRFAYASYANAPDNAFAIRFTGKAKDLLPVLLLSEFRAAVLSSLK